MTSSLFRQQAIKTLHCRLPDLHPDQLVTINTRYTEAVTFALQQLFTQGMIGKSWKVQREATKQMYQTMRKIPNFAALNAMLLDEACNEATELLHWIENRIRRTETFTRLTNVTVVQTICWLKGVMTESKDSGSQSPERPMPLLQPLKDTTRHPLQLLSAPFSEFVTWPGWGFPGSTSGGLTRPARLMRSAWAPVTSPQSRGGTIRLPGPSRSGDPSLGLGRTRWQLGGQPLRILQRALNRRGGLRVGEPRLLLRGGIPHLAVPVVRKVQVPDLRRESPETVVGVDIGANTLVAAVALRQNVPQAAKCVSGRQFCHQLRVQWQQRRTVARRQAKGVLHRIDAKIKRIVDHWTHVAARAVVDYATRQQGVVVIVLENLRDLRFARNRTPLWRRVTRFVLSVWARGQLHRRIREKALWKAIPVVELSTRDTRFSSKTCCKCGQINYRHRWQRIFRCPACNAVVPRDVNAATVLARRYVQCRT